MKIFYRVTAGWMFSIGIVLASHADTEHAIGMIDFIASVCFFIAAGAHWDVRNKQ